LNLLLAASLALNAVLLMAALTFVRSRGGFRYVQAKLTPAPAASGGAAGEAAGAPADADQPPHWRSRAELFAAAPARPGDVVMLGDSLTEFAPWADLLGRPELRNQGIAGDTVAGVALRLPAALSGPPRVVALMIGINDLLRGKEPEALIAAQRDLIGRIRAEAPGTRLIVQALLPVHPHAMGVRHNPRIARVNAALQASAQAAGAEWLDLHPLLGGDAGLTPHFSYDGLHLNGAGYAAWVAALRPHLSAS
jgi:lysophospholipase L1-like esterase